ncbi:MAG: hypothetical protein EOO11_11695 [Chitinophagaceae bacterium]|nr:MAG: hypothetical protein EOO11_11695 [Chitinophagaceae bacterium]
MKKILTLALALVAFSAASFAQSREAARDVVLGNGNSSVYRGNDRYDNRGNDRYDSRYDNNSPERRRDDEIARINRDFDYRITQVRADRRLSNREEKRAVKTLEQQRKDALRGAQQRYKDACDQRDRYARGNNNRDYRNGGRY